MHFALASSRAVAVSKVSCTRSNNIAFMPCCLQEKEALLQKLQKDVSALQDKCKQAEVRGAQDTSSTSTALLALPVPPLALCVCSFPFDFPTYAATRQSNCHPQGTHKTSCVASTSPAQASLSGFSPCFLPEALDVQSCWWLQCLMILSPVAGGASCRQGLEAQLSELQEAHQALMAKHGEAKVGCPA